MDKKTKKLIFSSAKTYLRVFSMDHIIIISAVAHPLLNIDPPHRF